MKISELIILLEKVKIEHEDIEVFYPDHQFGENVDIQDINVYSIGRGLKKRFIAEFI